MSLIEIWPHSLRNYVHNGKPGANSIQTFASGGTSTRASGPSVQQCECFALKSWERIQHLIQNMLQLSRYDLNRLCSTCKTIMAVALPRLYKTVVIKAPQTWSRLPSFESLLASDGDGLKYTTGLYVGTQQKPLKESQENPQDQPEEVPETRINFFLPQSSTSNALNTLVRLLILRLPRDQLELFR